MNELILLSFSHIFIVFICIASIIFIPKFFKHSPASTHSSLAYFIISLILINQGMDLYREGYLDEWKLGLPLHLCDFSSFSILIYLLTKKRDFFIFAFFFGIAGAGMSILTPDTGYGFPAVGYIQNQIGHTAIILGVSYAMVIDNQRPYLKDVAKALLYATILLFAMYGVNYLLGPPANYWFIVEKPIGQNVTSFMRPAPFHMIDIWLLAVVVCYLIYLPYYLKDRKVKIIMAKKLNKIVDRKQIPIKYRARRPKIVQWAARLFLRSFRWKVEGKIPSVQGNENLIIIAGPHTSNWDGVFGFAAILGLDAKISFFGKHSLFDQPILGRFLNYMGGIPVDKTNPGKGLTEMAIKNMQKLNGSLIAMSPEGTRAKTEKFKTGFLRIAKAVEGKIFLASFDFDNKRIFLDTFFDPSGDNELDLSYVKEYFMQFGAKRPENY